MATNTYCKRASRRARRRLSPRRGFTLTEFAVIFVIVALIGILLLPWYARKRARDFPASDEGRQQACVSNERRIGVALLAYAQDYDDRFPLAGYARVTPPARFPTGWGITENGKGHASPPDD